MVKRKAVSGLASKLGGQGQSAFNKHKGDETTLSGGADLPAGIENGIARLVQCKFGTFQRGDNKGEFYFLAAGTVVMPEEHEGIPVKGLRTQIGPEPLCDTPNASGKRKKLEDHVAWVLNQLRLLGVNTDSIDFDDLETVAQALEEQKPQFRFRTWKGEKQTSGPYAGREPRVNHDWRGLVQSPVTVSSDDGMADETVEEDLDLAALAEAADNEDEDAVEKLTELAYANGYTDTELGDIPTWAEFVDQLEGVEGESTSGKPDEGDEDDEAPGVGDIREYKPPGARKEVEVKILTVNQREQTVTAQNLADGKTYKRVSWSKLVG